jgi:hypothetical protein
VKKATLFALVLIAWTWAWTAGAAEPNRGGGATARDEEALAFAFCVWDESQIKEGLVLAESIRAFGGRFSGAPVLAYFLKDLAASSAGSVGDFIKFDVEVRTFEAPPEATGFPLAEKIFAAAEAEAGLEGKAAFLAWMDPDTLVWGEPGDFLLDEGKRLGYRPVMH